MKKTILPLIIVGLINLSLYASAESFNLYGNVDDSNQYCNLLIDYYYNSKDFDAFYEYVVFRPEQYKYTLVYGKDLKKDNLKYVTYSQSHLNNPSSISTGSLNSLQIISNDYTYVGNVEGSLASSQFNDFKYKFLFIIGGFIFLLVFLFKVFRPRFVLHASNKGYDL